MPLMGSSTDCIWLRKESELEEMSIETSKTEMQRISMKKAEKISKNHGTIAKGTIYL